MSTESGRSAVVTGASKGIGRGIAIALARDGWDVVVNYSSNEGAAKETADAVADAGARAVVVGGDVTDPATSERLAEAACELGTLEAWVNNAGVSVLGPVVDTSVADMERMLAVNYMGTFHGVQAAARTMLAENTPGRIVNVASEAAVLTFRYLGPYAASKCAVVGLTQAAAIELGPHGISVNAVGPGTTETDMVFAERRSEVSITGDPSDDVRDAYLANIPLGRFCTPDDTGALVAFLVSPAGAYVTGQIICNNGGSVLH
jgi:NAD(P)-dependent dehydrogenase (short-subunit alcohol dehydrogenase family)